jgi:hypothetical protein
MAAARRPGRAAVLAALQALETAPDTITVQLTLALPATLRAQTAYLLLVEDLRSALARLRDAGYLLDVTAERGVPSDPESVDS